MYWYGRVSTIEHWMKAKCRTAKVEILTAGHHGPCATYSLTLKGTQTPPLPSSKGMCSQRPPLKWQTCFCLNVLSFNATASPWKYSPKSPSKMSRFCAYVVTVFKTVLINELLMSWLAWIQNYLFFFPPDDTDVDKMQPQTCKSFSRGKTWK